MSCKSRSARSAAGTTFPRWVPRGCDFIIVIIRKMEFAESGFVELSRGQRLLGRSCGGRFVWADDVWLFGSLMY